MLTLMFNRFISDVSGNYFDPSVSASAGVSQTKFNLNDEKNGYVQKIPFSKLMNLSENDNRELLLDIYSQKEQFIKTITQENCGDELMLVAMKIVNKIAALPLFEINEELFLVLAKDKNFWNNLIKFFKRSTNQMGAKKKKGKSKVQGVSVVDMLTAVGKLIGNVRKILGERKKVNNFLEELTEVLTKADVKLDVLGLGGSVPSNSVRNWSVSNLIKIIHFAVEFCMYLYYSRFTQHWRNYTDREVISSQTLLVGNFPPWTTTWRYI